MVYVAAVAVTDPNPKAEACALCGRTILRGERVSQSVDGDGETVGVCELCKGRAEAAGWSPAAYAATMSRRGPDRRRAWVGSALRERFVRRIEGERQGPVAEAEEPEDAEPEPEPERSPLDVFNSSGQARKVAGVVRSLGEPQDLDVDPDGVEVRTFRVGQDEQLLYRIDETAFRDHWDHVDRTYEAFAARMYGESWDPSLQAPPTRAVRIE